MNVDGWRTKLFAIGACLLLANAAFLLCSLRLTFRFPCKDIPIWIYAGSSLTLLGLVFVLSVKVGPVGYLLLLQPSNSTSISVG
jgi:hypothetical protein